jgi:hypothetical protein
MVTHIVSLRQFLLVFIINLDFVFVTPFTERKDGKGLKQSKQPILLFVALKLFCFTECATNRCSEGEGLRQEGQDGRLIRRGCRARSYKLGEIYLREKQIVRGEKADNSSTLRKLDNAVLSIISHY